MSYKSIYVKSIYVYMLNLFIPAYINFLGKQCTKLQDAKKKERKSMREQGNFQSGVEEHKYGSLESRTSSAKDKVIY